MIETGQDAPDVELPDQDGRPVRLSVVIDEEGVVRHVIPDASPGTHDDVVLQALSDLQVA